MELDEYKKYRDKLERNMYEEERLEELHRMNANDTRKRIEELNNSSSKEFIESYVKDELVDKLKHEDIIKIVEDYYNIQRDILFQKPSPREITEKRQICQYFLKHYTKLSLSFIGEITGDRNHTTVIYSVRTVVDLNSYDKAIQKQVREIRNIINSKLS